MEGFPLVSFKGGNILLFVLPGRWCGVNIDSPHDIEEAYLKEHQESKGGKAHLR